VALTLSDIFAKLKGMSGDHAKDQKKLAVLLEEPSNFSSNKPLEKKGHVE